MATPYGLRLNESCLTCKLKADNMFCDLPSEVLRTLDSIKFVSAYPVGAVLFVEGQEPRGIFVLCTGRVKLSMSAADGKTFIPRIAGPGEVLGFSATVSGRQYDLTAETLEPSQITFVKREDFIRLLREHNDVCFRVAQKLSDKYNAACQDIRTLGLSPTAAGKLARLLLEWRSHNTRALGVNQRVSLALSHEEIGQMIGTSRETVTRLFAQMKRREVISTAGATIMIRDVAALEALAAN